MHRTESSILGSSTLADFTGLIPPSIPDDFRLADKSSVKRDSNKQDTFRVVLRKFVLAGGAAPGREGRWR